MRRSELHTELFYELIGYGVVYRRVVVGARFERARVFHDILQQLEGRFFEHRRLFPGADSEVVFDRRRNGLLGSARKRRRKRFGNGLGRVIRHVLIAAAHRAQERFGGVVVLVEPRLLRRECGVRHSARRRADRRDDIALAERNVFGRGRFEHGGVVYRLIGLERANHGVERYRGVEKLAVVGGNAVLIEHPLQRHCGNAARAPREYVLAFERRPIEIGLGIASHEERPVAVGELPENNGVVALSLDVAV